MNHRSIAFRGAVRRRFPSQNWFAGVGVVAMTAMVGLSSLGGAAGCSTMGLRSAVSMKMVRTKTSPKDASVHIDEEYVGPLYYVAAHGVRLPTGKHRISVTKEGYFPWDREVEADRLPLVLDVDLVAIPD